METREKNKYEMLEAVCGFFENEKSSFEQLSATQSIFLTINQIKKEIALNEKIISEGTKGKVVSKDLTQEALIKKALVIAGVIYGYAADKNDNELMIFSDVNSKTLGKLRDSEIPIVIESIFDKADEIGDGLITFGLTAEKRTAARELLNDYIGRYGSVKTGRGSKKTANETIKMLIKKANSKLKVLDKLMLSFKETDPQLFSKYTAARVIYDKVSRHNIPAEEQPAENVPAQ